MLGVVAATLTVATLAVTTFSGDEDITGEPKKAVKANMSMEEILTHLLKLANHALTHVRSSPEYRNMEHLPIAMNGLALIP